MVEGQGPLDFSRNKSAIRFYVFFPHMIKSLKGASKNTLFNIVTTVDPVLAFPLQTCITSASHIGMHPSKMTPALGRGGGC